ncbi:hypothetical protein ACQ4LE_003139 [Meloidogyne hapla]
MGKLKEESSSTSGSPVKGSPVKSHQYTSETESIQKKKKRKLEESHQNNGDHKNQTIVLESPQSSFSEQTLNAGIINSVEHEPQKKKKKKRKRVLEDSITDGDNSHFVGSSTNNNLIPSTSEIKQDKKIKESKLTDFSHSDEDEIDLEERHERAGSITSNTPTVSVMPKDMYCFCKYILDLEEQKTLHLRGKKANVKFNALLKDVPNVDPSYDLAQLQIGFVQFYRWATAMPEVPLTEAIKKVMEFVQTDHILQRYPEFPKLKSLWSIYINKCGIDSTQLFAKNNNLRESFRDKNNKNVIEAEEEFKRRKHDLIISCKEFLEKYKDSLFEPQITSIQKKLFRLEKEMTLENQAKGKPEKRQKKQRATAFDLFKKTKEGKYSDLSEEDRERKLLRQFEKLDPVQRNIYETIAEKI